MTEENGQEGDAQNVARRHHDAVLDARGLACPLPVLRARKALLGLLPGQRLLVEATDPMARIDIPHFCAEAGHELIDTDQADGLFRFLVERGKTAT